MEPLIGPEELAVWLGVPKGAVYQWRCRGGGPPAIKIGRHVRYDPETVRRWLAQQAAS